MSDQLPANPWNASPAQPMSGDAFSVVTPEHLDPREFLAYMQANVTPEALIADRPGMAKMGHILQTKFYHGDRKQQVTHYRDGKRTDVDMETDLGYYFNPNPKLALEAGTSTRYEYDSFRLKDEVGSSFYYNIPFWTQDPKSEAEFLRPEDVVPSGITSRTLTEEGIERACAELGITADQVAEMHENLDPALQPFMSIREQLFRQTLQRVPLLGGPEERYNYVQGEWTATGYVYEPGFKTRTVTRIREALRPGMKQALPPDVQKTLE